MVGTLLEQDASQFAFGVGGKPGYQIHTKGVVFKHDSSANAVLGIAVYLFDSLGQLRFLAFFGFQSLFGKNNEWVCTQLMTLLYSAQIQRSACSPVIMRDLVYQ